VGWPTWYHLGRHLRRCPRLLLGGSCHEQRHDISNTPIKPLIDLPEKLSVFRTQNHRFKTTIFRALSVAQKSRFVSILRGLVSILRGPRSVHLPLSGRQTLKTRRTEGGVRNAVPHEDLKSKIEKMMPTDTPFVLDNTLVNVD